MPPLYRMPRNAPADDFPPLQHALEEPNGLLAVGGDLSVPRLLCAYRRGIFPWYSAGQPILWWSPNPRMVLFPEHLRVPRSLRKTIRNGGFQVTLDRDFASVIRACAHIPRPQQSGTWITHEMEAAYIRLHQAGQAHSVEAWHNGELVGGLYGIAIGRVFFGESMFSRMDNASKVAFACFVKQIQHWGYELIDCQVYTKYLSDFGAICIPRENFESLLKNLCRQSVEADWSVLDKGR